MGADTEFEAHWVPTPEIIDRSNIAGAMRDLGISDYRELHRWSTEDRPGYWGMALDRLGIVFRDPPSQILGPGGDIERPDWLSGSRYNIVESCFTASERATAVVVGLPDGEVSRVTSGELRAMVGSVANGLVAAGYGQGDRIAIAMPMTLEAVVAYLAIVAIGGVVVSIADSFAAEEIGLRLRLTGASTVVTQDLMTRGGKELPMYEKVVAAGAETCIVVDTGADVALRRADLRWDGVVAEDERIEPHIAAPHDHTNILFSSGTTGEPKAIPWTQLTPIKAAADAHFHHDIHPGDVLAWPTNLGWMMGPWLIYASLVNDAAMALYYDAPTGGDFGQFVEAAQVTMLGVVPSLVSAWRSTACMEGYDWSALRAFSSTGEASNPSDMVYLMDLAGNKPVIEYCGGTEIGGGYITGTVVQPAVPSCFSTPALGLDLVILDDAGRHADAGEVFIVPPSIGLSTELLNRDHHEVYYEGVPDIGRPLRRHGDFMAKVGDGYYRAHGRVDDTMNLGGIKVSSAEIERVVDAADGVAEAAAIAVPPPGGGPDRLVIYAVPQPGRELDPEALRDEMQRLIREHLNPLFKVHDVVIVDALPRTASAKVMRRELRAAYGGD